MRVHYMSLENSLLKVEGVLCKSGELI